MRWTIFAAVACGFAFAVSSAHAQMRITEWMYSGNNGEFIEFTNMSGSPVDMSSGWAYSDSDRGMMDLELDAFGVVQPGESVILTETADAVFRAAWGLGPAVKIIAGNTNSNLGRNDEINLYQSGTLVDRLTFGDNRTAMDPPPGAPPTAGSIRTQNLSGNPLSLAALGANDVFQWALASANESPPRNFGSGRSAGGDYANPGLFYLAVPEPGSFALLLFGLAGIGWRRVR